MKLFSNETKYTYLFHYKYDIDWEDGYANHEYTRWIDANEDEKAFRKFFANRPESSKIWYERYLRVKDDDGINHLVLDM